MFDGGRAEFNPVEDGRVHDVNASINSVAHEFDWFLDKAVDSRRVIGLVDDDSVLGWFFHLCDYDGTFIAMALVEI